MIDDISTRTILPNPNFHFPSGIPISNFERYQSSLVSLLPLGSVFSLFSTCIFELIFSIASYYKKASSRIARVRKGA